MVYRNSISGLSSHAGKATALLGTYWPWTVGGTRGTAPRGLRAEPQPILPLPSPSWLLISCLSPRQPPVFRRGFIYVEADAYSSRVHHPIFTGDNREGVAVQVVPTTVRAEKPNVPSAQHQGPSTKHCSSTCHLHRNHDTAEHWALRS